MLPLFPMQMKYSLENKEKNVQEMFSSIAGKYDLNNTLLSLGIHYFWKHKVVQTARIPEKGVLLDLASGTGDIAIQLARQGKNGVKIISSDLNLEMLKVGNDKIRKKGLSDRILPVQGNAEKMQFKDGSFDLVTVGFGVRNFNNLQAGLREIFRILKPGGQFICLEFSKPQHWFWRKLYDFYSFIFLPKIGQWISKDRTGVYQYLPDSIRKFPDQELFKMMMVQEGFKETTYRNLTGGIVAIHSGTK
jgi:demethylmenaquinone methyltransferase/2-methoxy-6-polyprenyl-1,4-benzoquinol methylase